MKNFSYETTVYMEEANYLYSEPLETTYTDVKSWKDVINGDESYEIN